MNFTLENRRKSILLFVIIFITYAIIYMTKNCYSAAMASIVDEGILTKSETGFINAAFYLAYAIFQVVGGIVADKVRPDYLIFLGMIGSAGLNLAVYFVDGYVWLVIIWVLNAIVQFGVWPAIFRVVATELDYSMRPVAILLINVSGSVGLVLSYITAAFITYWKINFLFSAIALAVMALIFLVTYRIMLPSMVLDTTYAAPTEKEEKTDGKTAFKLLMRSGLPIICLVYIFASMLNLGIKAFAPTMLIECYKDITPQMANIMNILLVIAAPVGVMLTALPIFRRITEPMTLAIMISAAAPLLLVTVFIGDVSAPLVLISLFISMITLGACTPIFSYISRSFLKFNLVATVSGILNCMAAIGIVLSNYFFAALADAFGWQVTAIVWVALAILGIIFSLIAIPIYKNFKAKEKIV